MKSPASTSFRCALLVAAALAPHALPSARQPSAPLRSEVRGDRAVVAAGRTFAAEAGAQMLSAGGNAVDAGVAATFAAAVVEISHFGLGGEAPIIIYSARDNRVIVINGQGPAPKAASPELFAGRAAVPGNGPHGATVPAVVDAAALALEKYGTKTLSEVLAPAIALADGFPMYEFLSNYLASERRASEPYEWTIRTYYPDGRVTRAGEMFRQPNLAATLRALATAEQAARASGATREAAIQAGRDAFYKGPIAERMAAAVRAAGGVMTAEDLASYRGRLEEPASANYRGYTVHKAGFWNQGPALLQTLTILEGFDLAKMGIGSAEAIHTITEAIKLAYADRDHHYGDPDFVKVPGPALLSPQYAAIRRALIDPRRASTEHRPGDPERMAPRLEGRPADAAAGVPREPGDTTAIEVVDREGNLFSATPSSGWLLGGAFVAGDTGVPMSNRMQAFRLDPASPNVLAGGKRPRTTLTPTVVTKDGRPFLAIGTPGGDSQDQQILLVLLNMIDYGLDVQAAIEAPRFNSLHPQSSFDDHRAQPGVLEVERSVPAAVLEDLRARGHILRLRPAYGISTGVVAAGIDPATGRLRGGADPRRERALIAW
ncbi:MAG TPA: gamma-glutamyltransferase family protein [Vicinamibacterales bacterium]|nr:gamma-glutamyltransferase family protein [Vicinamibacterales bacterium]